MKYTRPILLAASALALFISACSQTEDLQTPGLEPQFGNALSDRSIDVSTAPAGSAYVLSYGSDPLSDSSGDQVLLQRFSTSGAQLWSRVVLERPDSFVSVSGEVVQSDSQGNAYAIAAYDAPNFDDTAQMQYYKIYTYNSNGTLQRSFDVGATGDSLVDSESKVITPPDMAVDASANSYIAIERATYTLDDDFWPVFTYTNLLRKYNAAETLLWEQVVGVGVPTGVAVSSDGGVYVSGRGGLARYTSSGGFSWRKPGFYQDVAVSGANIYTRNAQTLQRFSSSGQQLWSKPQGGLNQILNQDLDGDTAGNLYLSGKYLAGTSNWNAFNRKLSAAGNSQWTKTYGTPAFDDAMGIATTNGSEIFVTGTTKGSLAHPNRGQ